MIKLTDIWIAVPVEKELPEKDGPVHTVGKQANVLGLWFYKSKGIDQFKDDDGELKITHFLRHPTLAELLQVEGMREIAEAVWANGEQYGHYEAHNANAGDIPDFETTYNNLLNK
jgi:hypothetical protein